MLMATIILWIYAAGCWLIFAGSIYQAALDIKEQDIEFDRIRQVGRDIHKERNVSAWWWLFPPIKISKESKNHKEYERRYLKALSSEDTESMVNLRSKTTAWLYVGVGALLVSIEATWSVTEHYKLKIWLFVITCIAVAYICIVNMITSIRRAEHNKQL
jgi:hypothetical protein